MTDLERRLAELSPAQRARLAELLADRRLAEDGTTEDAFPLSMFQQGMWFLEQVRPGNPAYVVPGAVRVRGAVDAEVLRDALNEVVRRHEALRTAFRLLDGRPAQLVRPRLTVELPEIDLRQDRLTGTALDERIAAAAIGEPFDLETGPLVRMTLLRTADDESVLVLALHHLVSDRWSVWVLLSELAALYEAFAAGRPSPLPDLPVQYGDFAVWQREQRDQGRWTEQLAYWRERLAGAPAALELPTDRPRPAVQGFNGGTLPFELPEPLMRELGRLAHRSGATTYMALLAVFTVLLSRYGRQQDVVVGVPMAVRDRPELEPLIGYFVNTLAIRTDLGGEPSFGEVLDRVRTACLGAYEHQEVPFELVVGELNTARDLGRPPVYQVSFAYGREAVPQLTLNGAELDRLPVRSEGARFDLELQAFDRDGGLSGWFEYDRDLFDEATVARIAAHFRRLAEQVVADPDRPVDRLELLEGDDRRRVLEEFNATAREWPAGRGWIHEDFEEQARRHPEAEAVRFEGRGLTYGELNRRANRLAHRLLRLGVGRDVVVGVGLERSPELVVALLAVLKAGGAYLPLDPGLPPARLEHMVRDARVPVLLTRREELGRLPAAEAEVLCVEEFEAAPGGEPDDDPQVAVDGEDLAYVIYTSGSTGTPKGVMNVHAGIRNRLLWMQDAYGLDATDRVLQKTPFSFDVSVWEFFWPLTTGATLVVARPEGHRDGGYLARTIREERVTTVHFVPSMLQVFLQEPVEECTTLRRVVCSGEALPRDLQDRFLARSRARLYNLYGPTEAAVDVTHWTCTPEDGRRPVPIGRPIANTRVYVLDGSLRPVPVGVPGELHLGGRGLARGYLNRPGLTAERFVRDPFDADPGARLYRTGDLARFREDGALEFLGRLDHQVNLRGFRIEPGEIEAVLTAHPAVREAVVTARPHRGGDLRLVAHLTARGPGAPDPAELAGHLRRHLPAYMVPAVFEVLDALPLTPSGKVDRAALPEPSGGRPEPGARFTAPAAGLEHTLAGLWCAVLGVERVGAHDNFFDLGGHSLLMAELRSLLASDAGHRVSMVELFQHPTVASLAAYLSRPEGPAATPGPDARQRAENRRRADARRRQAAGRRARSRER
ncbi:amino acid adenylation domain-containing protein [Streptomyces sp. BE20]|uniref:amino acid adenylation domain-containing protein n=1 Tax=Streptomyces sp. BE20 TaxID=3002525 RepID=UPI002E79E0D1|nr:amino acid adenylation domain-containing protein [Streptomyces sp. BE20]MEE1825256.1 amino acid adenylation domain-containing protein [Streptomyces sp. BE20]